MQQRRQDIMQQKIKDRTNNDFGKYSHQIFICQQQYKPPKQQMNQRQIQQPSQPNKIPKASQKILIYLPVYLSVKINNIESIQIGENVAKLNLTFMFSVFFGDFSEGFIQQVCANLRMSFSRDDQIHLHLSRQEKDRRLQQDNDDQSSDSDDEQDEQQTPNIQQKDLNQVTHIKTFQIRKIFSANLSPYSFLTPFEIHDLIIAIELRKIELKFQTPQKKLKVQVKFNFMSVSPNDMLKCIYFEQVIGFAQYNIAPNLVYCENSINRHVSTLQSIFNKYKFIFNLMKLGRGSKNSKKKAKINQNNQHNPQQFQKKVACLQNKNFQYCNFHIPIYKKPMANFLSIYLPIWILSIITLSFFFLKIDQNSRMKNHGLRVAAVAALTLAFIPMVQNVREQTPKTSSITFVQFTVFLQVIATLIFLIEAWIIRQNQQYYFDQLKNPRFIAAVIITIWNTIIPVLFLLFYYAIASRWLNNFTIPKSFKLFPANWNANQQAGKYFDLKKTLLKNKNIAQELKQEHQNIYQGSKNYSPLKLPSQKWNMFSSQQDQLSCKRIVDEINKSFRKQIIKQTKTQTKIKKTQSVII